MVYASLHFIWLFCNAQNWLNAQRHAPILSICLPFSLHASLAHLHLPVANSLHASSPTRLLFKYSASYWKSLP
jgi:hypothetical protein